MTSTAVLVSAIVVVIVVLMILHELAWRVVRAGHAGAPRLAPWIAGSHLWLLGAPWRRRAAARFPGLFNRLAARFSRQRFTGLALTLVVLAALYALALLGGLVDAVYDSGGAIRIDETVNAAFGPYRAAWLLSAFLWITAIGAGPSLTAVILLATVLLWACGRTVYLRPLWIAFAGAQVTTWSAKYLIARPRPVFLPNVTEWNPSFPSGHATAVTALVGMLGLIVASNRQGLRPRFEVAFGTVMIIGLICFSRLFIGVHFLTDVTAGVLVGVFWLLVGYTALAFAEMRRTTET